MRSAVTDLGSQPIRNEFGDPRAASTPPAGKAAWGPRYGWGTARLSSQTDGPPGQGITGYVRLTVPSSQGRGGRGFGHLGNPDLTTNQVSGQPVLPGQKWTGSVFIRVQTAGVCIMAHAGAFYDANGTRISTFTFATATLTNGVWARISGTITAPANAAFMATYTVSAGGSTGNWETGDTLDGTGGMLVLGVYDGLFCDGLTPGWRYDSGSNGPSAGYPYTLASLAGQPFFQTETAALVTLPKVNADPLAGYSLYGVYDAINNDPNPTGATAQLIGAIGAINVHGGISQSGTAELRAQITTTATETYFRLSNAGNGGGYSNSYPQGRALGRHGASATITPNGAGAALRRHVIDGTFATTPQNVVWEGLTMTRADLGSPASRSAPIALLVWDRPHTVDEQAAVHRWLAARYGYALAA